MIRFAMWMVAGGLVLGGVEAKTASEWDARAEKYERDAAALENPNRYDPMRHKWPAMSQGMIDRLRGKATEARRAARETRERANRPAGMTGDKVVQPSGR